MKTHGGVACRQGVYLTRQPSGGSRPSYKGRGGGSCGNPDPEIRRRRFSKNFLLFFGPQCGLRIRGEAGSPGAFPGSVTGTSPLNHFLTRPNSRSV